MGFQENLKFNKVNIVYYSKLTKHLTSTHVVITILYGELISKIKRDWFVNEGMGCIAQQGRDRFVLCRKAVSVIIHESGNMRHHVYMKPY